MRYAKALLISALLSCSFAIGCGGNSSANATSQPGATNNSNSAKTSVEDLGLIINVPYEAEDAVWKENAARNKLTAVLRFDQEDTAKIVAEAEKVRPAEPTTIASETWFPSDLTVDGEIRGDESMSGRSYAPDQFLQPPYNSGRLVRIDNSDYFVLELTVK